MYNKQNPNIFKTWLEYTYSKLTGREVKSIADIIWLILFAFIVIIVMTWFANLFITQIENTIQNIVLLSITILMLTLIWQNVFRKPPKWIQKIMPVIGFILMIVLFGLIILIVFKGSIDLFPISNNWESTENSREPENEEGRFSINIPEMVRISGGNYHVGLSDVILDSLVKSNYADLKDFSNELPQIEVKVKNFEISKYEIDVKQFNEYMIDVNNKTAELSNKFDSETQPIVNVSWNDANNYCLWLSQKTGEEYRLPSEIEWEIASKGSSQNLYAWGNGSPNENNCNFKYSFIDSTVANGKMPSNRSIFGVYNMSGNVAEWCSDWYYPNYYDLIEDKKNSELIESHNKVVRGGSWKSEAFYLRCTARYYAPPNNKSNEIGFRIVKFIN